MSREEDEGLDPAAPLSEREPTAPGARAALAGNGHLPDPMMDDAELWVEPAAELAEAPVAAADTADASSAIEVVAAANEPAPQNNGSAEVPWRARSGKPRVIAIASGKGGVGKSLLAASVSIYLAQLNKRVVLVDASLGSENLHTLVGVDEPRRSLHRFLRNEARHLADMVCETPFTGLGLIAGQGSGLGAANPRPTQKKRLLSQLRSLEAEYVVLDIATGSGFNALDTLLAADLHVIVMHPEPTSIESAFRLIKSALLRKLRSTSGVEDLIHSLDERAHCGLPTPNQLREAALGVNDELATGVATAMSELRPLLIVNNTRTRDDLELGPALAIVARRHLGLPVEYLGYVESDDLVWACIRKRRPLLVEYPEAKVSRDIERIARRLVTRDPKERAAITDLPRSAGDENHYEILGLHPAATDEEIRRAQRSMRRLYDGSSNAIFGLAPPDEAQQVLQRAEEAYATLIDPEKKHLYNQTIFPEWPAEEAATLKPASVDVTPIGLVPPAEVETAAQARPEMPIVDENTAFTGELLRQIREARGVDLQELAERTKISVTYLGAIEAENFPDAPAPVYVRGFVKAVAKYLGLGSDRVADSYMQRYGTTRQI